MGKLIADSVSSSAPRASSSALGSRGALSGKRTQHTQELIPWGAPAVPLPAPSAPLQHGLSDCRKFLGALGTLHWPQSTLAGS